VPSDLGGWGDRLMGSDDGIRAFSDAFLKLDTPLGGGRTNKVPVMAVLAGPLRL